MLCLVISGCDETNGEVNVNEPENENNPPSTPTSDASGTWTGTISGYGETITATMTITQNGDSITGTYLLDHEGDTDSGTVNGTLSNGTGTLTFNSSGGTDASARFYFWRHHRYRYLHLWQPVNEHNSYKVIISFLFCQTDALCPSI